MISNEKTYLFLLAFMIFSSASLCKYSANIFVHFFSLPFFLHSFCSLSLSLCSILFVLFQLLIHFVRFFLFVLELSRLMLLILLLHFCICISCVCARTHAHRQMRAFTYIVLYVYTLTVDMDMDLFSACHYFAQ